LRAELAEDLPDPLDAIVEKPVILPPEGLLVVMCLGFGDYRQVVAPSVHLPEEKSLPPQGAPDELRLRDRELPQVEELQSSTSGTWDTARGVRKG
jgi:hypothetical protein